jgi:hypothetical protein
MHFLVTTAIVFVMALSASAQDNAKIQEEVIKVDRARTAALLKGDGDAWAMTIADNCRWTVMATGVVEQNKAERAAGFTGSPIERSALEISDEKFHFSRAPAGGLLVTQTGESGNGRFVRLYSKVDDRWQMVALYTENPLN